MSKPTRKVVGVVGTRRTFDAYARERLDEWSRQPEVVIKSRLSHGRATVELPGGDSIVYLHVASEQTLRGISGPVELVWGHDYETKRWTEIERAARCCNLTVAEVEAPVETDSNRGGSGGPTP